MKKDIKAKIKDEIYGCDFLLMVCSWEKIVNRIKKDCPGIDAEGLATSDGQCITIKHPKHGRRQYMWLNEFNWTVSCQGLLAHETLHLVFENMKHVDIKYYHEDYTVNEEAFTYYFQYIYQKLLYELKVLYEKENNKKSKSKSR